MRIFLTFLCFMVINGNMCNAYIDRGEDSFDESVKIYSVQQKIGDIAQFNFFKTIEKTEKVHYQIYASSHLMKKNAFAKDFAEIKIDGSIYKIDVVRTEDYKDTDHGLYAISSTTQLSDEAVEALKSAQKVVLRYHRESGYQDLVEVPDSVLAEWKQVIATEK